MNPKQSLLSPIWYHVTNLVVDHGQGAYVYTTDGKEYLDFTSGIGVTSTGHCHPRVVKAIQDQAAKIIHAQINVYYHEGAFRTTEALREFTPAQIDSFFLCNSGAEAVEAAAKLARHATKKVNLIVFQGAFHGRTGQATAMTTSKASYRAGYQPLPSGVVVAPYPYAYRYGWSPEEAARFCLQELDMILHSQSTPDDTAAIVVEPVLGEGGYVVPPASFMQGLHQICTDNGILLIADEVQCGVARTGRFFGFEHFDVEPDIIIIAKGIGSGFPISAIAAPRALMEKWQVGSHGGTYGANPLGCAAAEATLRVIQDEHLVENAATQGKFLLESLADIQPSFPELGDVRGLGLMVGCEFRDPHTHEPLADVAEEMLSACFDQGLILMDCGTFKNVVRWIPPLIVTRDQIEKGLMIFTDALEQVLGQTS